VWTIRTEGGGGEREEEQVSTAPVLCRASFSLRRRKSVSFKVMGRRMLCFKTMRKRTLGFKLITLCAPRNVRKMKRRRRRRRRIKPLGRRRMC
jgi:hypothetical protein